MWFVLGIYEAAPQCGRGKMRVSNLFFEAKFVKQINEADSFFWGPSNRPERPEECEVRSLKLFRCLLFFPCGSAEVGGHAGAAWIVCAALCVHVCVQSGLTQHGQTGGTRPHGGLDGLALKDGVVHQLHPLDAQVMLAGAVVADHGVARVPCKSQHRQGHNTAAVCSLVS